jgi:hypothetical protein
VYAVEVPDASVGLLIVDGELKRTLQPDFYAYWKFNRTVKVDLRLQANRARPALTGSASHLQEGQGAEKILFAEPDAVMPENGVGGSRVEINVWQHVFLQIRQALHRPAAGSGFP